MRFVESSLIVVAAVFALTGTRSTVAQPTDLDLPEDVDEELDAADDAADDPVAAEPVSEPEPAPAPAADPAKPAPAPAAVPADRPVGMTMGIGVGYLMPTAIDTPNIASARFRLAGGIIFEPRIQLETASQSFDDGTNSTSDGVTTLGLAASVLYPLRTRGDFDFLVIGSLFFDRIGENPEGDDNNRTDTSFGLGWGLGINYWLSTHWSVSFLASNPLLSYGSTTQQNVGGETTSSTFRIGADFDPNIWTMIHLFY